MAYGGLNKYMAYGGLNKYMAYGGLNRYRLTKSALFTVMIFSNKNFI